MYTGTGTDEGFASALGAKKDWGGVLDVVTTIGKVDDAVNAKVISRVCLSATPIAARVSPSSRIFP